MGKPVPPLCYESIDRRSLLLALLGGAPILISSHSARAKEQVGSVEEVKGEAFAEANLKRRILDRAAPVFVRDLVGTGPEARLTLHLGSDTILRIGENARLIIERFLVNAGGEITLQAGPMLYDHREDAPPARMRIRSEFGQIAVRGTRFFAGPSAGFFGVFVEAGSVAVTAGGARVLVDAGQGTNIGRVGAAPTPAAPWKPERIRAAFASVMLS